VPALIVEELEDGSYTVLAPSVPTPMAGAIYILPRERVHPVDVPFTKALAAARSPPGTISAKAAGARLATVLAGSLNRRR
jgi:uncharacterized membrane protein